MGVVPISKGLYTGKIDKLGSVKKTDKNKILMVILLKKKELDRYKTKNCMFLLIH